MATEWDYQVQQRCALECWIHYHGSPSLAPRIVVTGNPNLPASQRTFYENFNTAAFQAPVVGTFGDAAKYIIRGPGINKWDISVFRNFRAMDDRLNTQFRCEAYNAFSHTQFSTWNTTARFNPAGTQINQEPGEDTAARTSLELLMCRCGNLLMGLARGARPMSAGRCRSPPGGLPVNWLLHEPPTIFSRSG